MVPVNKGSRFIFVGGAPRSGTTLVQNMLDSHPDILGGPEFIHIPDIISLRNKLRASITAGWIDLFCSYADVDFHISALINSFLLPFADKYGCKFISEKTPGNIRVFSDLISLFPGSRFIHVVRDPRAIVASILQVGVRAGQKGINTASFTANLPAAISHTKKCFQSGFFASTVAPERVLTVAYEQLVREPEAETKKMCEFLEIEWCSQMTKPADIRHLGEDAITINSGEIWYDKQNYNRNPDVKDIDKWRTILTRRQQASVCDAFKDCDDLLKLGYDLSGDELGRSVVSGWRRGVDSLGDKVKKCFRLILPGSVML